jgi:mannose-6-phosphate isomerase-like protein (cupin superfamily)
MEVVNLNEKLSRVTEYWSPKIVGEINESYVKVVKFKGAFVWHHHDDEDEMFLVVKGRMKMRFRDRDVFVSPGEFIIVPKGCPKASSTCPKPTTRSKLSCSSPSPPSTPVMCATSGQW